MRLILAFVLTTWCGLAAAQNPTHQVKGPSHIRAEVVSFGEYASVPIDHTEDAPGTVSGVVYVTTTTPSLVKQTTDVPLFLGAMFGITVQAPDLPAGQAAPITVRASFPPVQTPDGRIVHGSTWEASISAEPSFVGLCASKEWHLVPGPYSITLLHVGRVIASQQFTLTLDTAPEKHEPCLPAPAVS